MTTYQQGAMKQALEALYDSVSDNKDWIEKRERAINGLRQALEAEQQASKKGSFEAVFGHLDMTPDDVGNLVIALQNEVANLRQTLEVEQQPEPVAYRHLHEDGWEYYDAPTGEDCNDCEALYNHALRTPSDEEIIKLIVPGDYLTAWGLLKFARSVLAKAGGAA